jgi:hypothetical protein
MSDHKSRNQDQQADETPHEQGRDEERAGAADGSMPGDGDGRAAIQVEDEPHGGEQDNRTPANGKGDNEEPVNKPANRGVDLTRLRLSQDFANNASTKKLIVAVKIRRPNKQEFIRVRPGDEWQFSSALLEHDREIYIVDSALWGLLQAEISPAVLKLATTRQGDVFLWSLKLPSLDGRDDHWSMSRRAAAEHAETRWVRVVANMDAGLYDVHAAASELDEPVWPDEDFTTILELAFKNRVIDSVDHPVVKKLRGEL